MVEQLTSAVLRARTRFTSSSASDDLRERQRVVERAMRLARVDAELPREVHELAARRKRSRASGSVSYVQRSNFLPTRLRTMRCENPEVELVAVVRDDDVLAAEVAERRPDVLEVRRVATSASRQPCVSRSPPARSATRGFTSEWILLDDLAVAHADRGDLDDLGRLSCRCRSSRDRSR